MKKNYAIQSRLAGLLVGVALAAVNGCAASPGLHPAATKAIGAAREPIPTQGEDIGPLIQPIIERTGIPGMSAVVLHGNEVIAQGVAGVRKAGAPERIEIDDQFEISSCAKAMTAALVAMLAEEGTLDWNAPLSTLFPDEPIDPAWQRVSLRDVLAHRAGVRDHFIPFLRATWSDEGNATTTRRRFAMKVLAHPPSSPPREAYVYSNADYILAAAALEKATGRAWEDLMQERLFAPLGMTTAGFGPPGTQGQIDQPWGHGRRRVSYIDVWGTGATPFDPGSASADYPRVWAPVGLVHMSVSDWAKFVVWQLRGSPLNPKHQARLLSAATFAQLQGTVGTDTYAGGWMLETRAWAKGSRPGDTGRVLFHAGDNGRWNSVVWVAPEIDFAILIANNRAHTGGTVDEVASLLVRRFAPRR